MKIQNANGYWTHVCGKCADNAEYNGMSEHDIAQTFGGESQDRYCAGVYAGHYCDEHWQQAGYRDDLPNMIGGMSENEIEAHDYAFED